MVSFGKSGGHKPGYCYCDINDQCATRVSDSSYDVWRIASELINNKF